MDESLDQFHQVLSLSVNQSSTEDLHDGSHHGADVGEVKVDVLVPEWNPNGGIQRRGKLQKPAWS